MKSRYTVITSIVIVILLLAVIFLQKNSDLKQYSNPVYGISFSYPSTYSIAEKDVQAHGTSTVHRITLIHADNLPAPVNGEGPQAITIDIHENSINALTTEEWIRTSKESNFKLGSGTVATTTVSGLPALSYRWSGLYEGTTITTALPSWVYVFSVTYMEMGAEIIQDFVQIRESVQIEK